MIRDARDVTQTCPPPRLATPPALLQFSIVDGILIILAILERRIELAEARGIAPSAPTNAVAGPSIEAATPRATEPPVEDAVPAPEPDREPTMLASPSASRDISITPKATLPAPPPPPRPSKPARPALDLETLLGAKGSVWIGGLALLLGAVFLLRYSIEAGLLTLTTLKVFLLDMAELDGALRPLSFIGLGVVLLGIGRLYQTVLKSDDA